MDTGKGIIAHFYLAEINMSSYMPKGIKATFKVVGNEHNKTWAASTPTGELTMQIANPSAVALFGPDDLGEEFEVTVRKLQKAPTA